MTQPSPRYVEIDVEETPNSWPLQRVFQCLGNHRSITTLAAPDPWGDEAPCRITGWSAKGPCPAYAVLVADSGEGAVTLVYGGDQGVRLKALDNNDPWDLSKTDQWGEPCLLLDTHVQTD